MSYPAPRRFFSYREYLELEERSNVRHEFFDGEIYAMAGGTPEHAVLCAAVTGLLFAALGDGPCRVFSSDLRVRAVPTGLVTYPDVTVICGEIARDPDGPSTVTNPTVVVEVLSGSTEAYDRGDKLEHYRSIDSLSQICLVSHEARAVEIWRREGAEWLKSRLGAGEAIDFPALGVSLEVDAIYERARVGL